MARTSTPEKRRSPVPVKIVNRALSDPIAVSAVIIAFCALTATIWQGHLMREHNRQSVRPWLDLEANFALPNKWLGLTLSNEGQGPAIIQGVTLFIDGTAHDPSDRNGWPSVIDELNLKKPWVKYRTYDPGDVLRPGAEDPLFGSPSEEFSHQRKVDLREATKKLTVQICYCSLYSDCQIIESRYRGGTSRQSGLSHCSDF